MTPQEAKKMLEAKLKCLIAETSGTNHDCNMRLCDGCPLNYEQGNMGEQKQALDMAIKALEQTELNPSYNGVKTELKPCEDAISRDKVIMLIDEAAEKYPYKVIGLPDTYSNYNQGWADACDWLYANIESDNLPSVTPKAETEAYNKGYTDAMRDIGDTQ